MEEWYKETNDVDKIFQGEILLNFPIVTPKQVDGKYKLQGEIKDCIVISQACDLDNRKIENVILAELIDIKIFIEALVKKDADPKKSNSAKLKAASKDIAAMNKGHQPRYHLLKGKETDTVKFSYKIIDFSRIHAIPFDNILEIKKSKKITVELQSPYMEYVGQRFGNFYSRIGLPKGIRDQEIDLFIKEHILIADEDKP